MKPSEHLAAARDEIVKGWTKGTIERSNGSVCSVGAIARVAKQQQTETLDDFIENCTTGEEAAESLRKKIREMTGKDFIGIEHYNDDPDTTQEDVLAAFDKAIAALEERGD